MSDASVLLRDIAGDAAQKTATKINPSEDSLNQIDEPAEDNTWHDVPNMSASSLKAQARDQYNKQKPFSRGDVQNAAGDATQNAHPSGSRDPADAAMLEAESRDQGTDSGMDPGAGANAAAGTLLNKASANVPDETKDKAQDKARAGRDRTLNYVNSKVPKERRDQTILRLKKMIVEIQSHSDCKFNWSITLAQTKTSLDQQSIETLLSLAEEYGGHSKNLSQQGAGTVKGAHSDTALTSAETDLKVCYRFHVREQRNADLYQDLTRTLRQLHIDR